MWRRGGDRRTEGQSRERKAKREKKKETDVSELHNLFNHSGQHSPTDRQLIITVQ